MKSFKIVALVLAGPLLIALVVAVALLGRSQDMRDEDTTTSTQNSCLPAFRDGGGPYYLPNSPFRENIAPNENDGQKLTVEGHVFDSDCSDRVGGAVVDIWQANESGEYEDEYYRGQVRTDENGYYRFETVVPLGYGEGTAYRPPHIHFKVFVDGQEVVTSQMFFDDVRGRAGFEDEYIISVKDADDQLLGSHDIVLPDFEL